MKCTYRERRHARARMHPADEPLHRLRNRESSCSAKARMAPAFPVWQVGRFADHFVRVHAHLYVHVHDFTPKRFRGPCMRFAPQQSRIAVRQLFESAKRLSQYRQDGPGWMKRIVVAAPMVPGDACRLTERRLREESIRMDARQDTRQFWRGTQLHYSAPSECACDFL